jgi:hypothetical protein
LQYEYDEEKSEATLQERGIDFDFAARVFAGGHHQKLTTEGGAPICKACRSSRPALPAPRIQRLDFSRLL